MIETNTFLIVFGIFCLLTWRDLFYPATPATGTVKQNSHHKYESSVLDTVEGQAKTVYEPTDLNGTPNLDDLSGAPTVKILFCSSCGYKHAFDEMSRLLQEKYPHLRIIGATHHPGWLRNQLSNLISASKMIIMGLILFNIDPFQYMRMPTPSIWTYMQQHKLYCSMLVFFLTNTIGAQLMSTGAFEIYYNDMPIWSKLETGRMPAPVELIQMIDSHLSLAAGPRGKFAATDFITDS
ncbi:Thioredoxin reductase-like selenoprotein T-like, partial [Fragariocoptes setiger]